MSERILINFPTNIGDTIMALPVLDTLKASFPQGRITAIASGHTREFLLRNNFINEVVIFNKFWRTVQKIRFCISLRNKFDVIVDLKNSFLPVILGTRLRTPFVRKFSPQEHSVARYLKIINKIKKKDAQIKSNFLISDQERRRWDSLSIPPSLFLACSSRSELKRYPYELFKRVVDDLKKEYPLVILGEANDRPFYADTLNLDGVIDLVGKTTLSDIFYLLKNYARLLLCVDSSIMHLASYINLPVVALFGPTEPTRYGPWSSHSFVLRSEDLNCVPCQEPKCSSNIDCMKIDPKRVIEAVKSMDKNIGR